MRRPQRWPDGALDEASASADLLTGTLRLLRRCALEVRAARDRLGSGQGSLTQEALSRRAHLYDDATNRLETGSAWLDLTTLVNLLDAAGLQLQVVDKVTKEPPVHR